MNLVVHKAENVVDCWFRSSTLMLKYHSKFNVNVDSIIEVDYGKISCISKMF